MKMNLLFVLIVTSLVLSCAYEGERTPDNTELATYTFDMPDSLQTRAATGELQSHTCNLEFAELGAKFSIYIETIQLDSAISIIKSVRTVLDQGSAGTTFTAIIDNAQEKVRNLQQVAKRPATVVVRYERIKGGTEVGSKIYDISSTGECKDRIRDGKVETF